MGVAEGLRGAVRYAVDIYIRATVKGRAVDHCDARRDRDPGKIRAALESPLANTPGS